MTSIIREAEVLSIANAEKAGGIVNPFLKTVKFIFADDKPNINGQAIPYEEFANLSSSAIGMPIKMRFLGHRAGAGSHQGSIPIGHVRSIQEQTSEDGQYHQLIAEGVLYADEYPDIVEYLEESFAEDKAPGISWELSYHDSIIEQGVSWLKGVIARAATFVKHPAYGKRTALLALASDATLTEEEIEEQVTSLFAKEPQLKGGTENVTLEEALAEIERLKAEVAAKDETIKTQASENEALTETASKYEEAAARVEELEEQVAGFEKAVVVADRTNKMVEAGVELDSDEEALAKKQELWAAMSEEIFEELISTVTAVAKRAPERRSDASVNLPRTLALPKITPAVNGSTPDIMTRIRGLRTQPVVDSDE